MYTICSVSQRSHSTSRPWYKAWHAVIPHSEQHIGTGGGRLNEGEGDDMDNDVTDLLHDMDPLHFAPPANSTALDNPLEVGDGNGIDKSEKSPRYYSKRQYCSR